MKSGRKSTARAIAQRGLPECPSCHQRGSLRVVTGTQEICPVMCGKCADVAIKWELMRREAAAVAQRGGGK